MHLLGWYASFEQGCFGGLDHGLGAADKHLVHAGHRQQGVNEGAHLVRINAALQQVDFLRLARQDVDQRQATPGSGLSGLAALR